MIADEQNPTIGNVVDPTRLRPEVVAIHPHRGGDVVAQEVRIVAQRIHPPSVGAAVGKLGQPIAQAGLDAVG